VTPDGKVILNTATVSDLDRLPGVGKRRAEQIIALRARLKRFRRVTDLLRVKGIGVRGLRRLKPHVVLDPPAVSDGGAAPVRDGG
jgi:competence protein ComEA